MAFILCIYAAFKLLKNKYNKDAEYHKGLKDDYDCWFHIALLSMLAGDLS